MRFMVMLMFMSMFVMIFVFVIMGMRVGMFCSVRVGVFVGMPMIVVVMFMAMFVRQMNIKLHAFDLRFVLSRNVEMVAVEMQLFEFVFELMGIHAEVEQRADKHVAADAAENIQVKSFH